MAYAVAPKTQGDDDKLMAGLQRVAQEFAQQHLAGGVHSSVGSTGDDHAWSVVTVPAEQGGQGGLDLSLHGAQTGLGRPAREGGTVVREVDAHAHDLRFVVRLTVIHSWRVYGASGLTARLRPRDP